MAKHVKSLTQQRPVDEDGYKLLAAAIVAQACEDYLDAKRILLLPKLGRIKRMNAESELIRALVFFRSSWCSMLADIEPLVLLEMLDQRAKEDK